MAHGFYENARCRATLVEDPADSFDVVAYDARGHGGSDGPDWGYGIDDRVADLVGPVEALGLRDPVLFGHSAGGSTVARAAARRLELPSAVVLEDPDAWRGKPETSPAEMEAFVRDRVAELTERSVEDIAAESDRDGERASRSLTRNRAANIARFAKEEFRRTPAAFPDVAAPTLVLKADAAPEERAEDLAAADALPDGRLVHVPGADTTRSGRSTRPRTRSYGRSCTGSRAEATLPVAVAPSARAWGRTGRRARRRSR